MIDIYQSVTDTIIAELERGAAPWVKPWRTDSSADCNLISGKPYQGINRLLLGVSSMAHGFHSGTWASYKQWSERGYQVQAGQKGTHIVFFKPMASRVNDDGETESGYCVIRGYTVFNACQTDAPISDAESDAAPFDADAACEETIVRTGAMISHGKDAAFYMPSQDRIQLPDRSAFNSPASYYATAFHELSHWTGAKHRLDRDLSGRYGNPAYAFEELVAEISAAYLCADHRISGELRHAGYIESWLKACRDDKKAIFKAAALAQKATTFINECYSTEAIAA